MNPSSKGIEPRIGYAWPKYDLMFKPKRGKKNRYEMRKLRRTVNTEVTRLRAMMRLATFEVKQ